MIELFFPFEKMYINFNDSLKTELSQYKQNILLIKFLGTLESKVITTDNSDSFSFS